MDADDRFDRIEGMIKEIHQSVVRIENVHGQKLEALSDGLSAAHERLDRMDQRLDRMDQRLDRMETDMRDVKRTTGLLHAIANDHESRLQRLENTVQDHLADHA